MDERCIQASGNIFKWEKRIDGASGLEAMCQPKDPLLPGVIDLVTEPEIMRPGTEEDRCEAEVGGTEIGRR